MKHFAVVSFIACLLLVCMLGYAGDKKIPRKQIPDAVMKAFAEKYPHAVIKGQAMENENGATYYEIESLDGKTKRDLLYTPEGKIFEMEESLTPDELADAMKHAIGKEYPKGKIVKAEKVSHDTLTGYEVRVQDGKKTHGISFDARGNMIKATKEKVEKDEKGEEKED
jgi:hypothetical protein